MFFIIKNLAASAATPVEKPWEISVETPDTAKGDYQNWCVDPATDHAFISAFEGVLPNVRVSGTSDRDGGNPPVKMHGMIVDYDAPQDVIERIAQALKSPACEYKPAYFYPTLRHMRAVWMYEDAVNLPTSAAASKAFLKILVKKLALRKWAAGFEEETALVPSKYYAMHGEWKPVYPDYRVPKNMLDLWLFKACESFRLVQQAEPLIPIAKVAEEVERRWPGRWRGPFEIGARGLRVWDPTATDHTMCQVHQDGLVVYNGDPKSFMSWQDLFGRKFVESFEADRIAPIVARTLYDLEGEKFYVKADDGTYVPAPKSDFAQFLRISGFSGAIPRGDTASDIDRCEYQIKARNTVFGARPFVYRPMGVIVHQGRRVLNTARCVPLQPAPPGTIFTLSDLRKQAPYLWEFFSTFFNDPVGCAYPQMLYFLAWLKLFYTSALRQAPQPGQALVIAGPPSCGKTFLVDVVLSGMMGGVSDASNYIARGTPWTDFMEYGVAKIDDAVCKDDPKAHARFSELLKSMVANPMRTVSVKYHKEGQVEWISRIIVCMNDDPQSIRMMPALDISAATKFSLLKTQTPATKFGEREENQAKACPELPILARFLLEWKYPEYLLDRRDTRYLLKPYHHPDLLVESVQAGPTHSLYELLAEWSEFYRSEFPDRSFWEGNATNLFSTIQSIESLRPLVTRYDSYRMGRLLSNLASKGLVEKLPLRNGLARYRIPMSNFVVDEGPNSTSDAFSRSLGMKPGDCCYTEEGVHESRRADPAESHPRLLSELCDQAPGDGPGEEE